jgi:NADPH-dependent glutamate synthase beta subunit-like oxidoreductase/ferredoxin
MKQVRVQAVVDYTKCSGCVTCTHVCPTMAYVPALLRPIRRHMAPPCNAGCPIGNDVEGFVQLIKQGMWRDAFELLRDTNPLPGVTGRVCDSPCEGVCNRGAFDEPVSIRALERALGDWAHRNIVKMKAAPPRYKEKVAVIGSGPAGLSCAYQLKRKGFGVTVFEQHQEIGGILRFGIPSYRLPRDVLDCEVGRLRDMGIEFRVGRKWGENLTMDEIERYDAVFLALGFQRCRVLGVPGEDCPQVIRGVDFLAQVNSGRMPELGSSVLVIGGGNSAVDSARTVLRLHAKPTLVYRRREEDMPAIASEIEELKNEGIEILTLVTPVRFLLGNGSLKEVECIRMELGDNQIDGRRWPVAVPGSEFRMAADAVIHCIGETGDLDGYPLELKCEGERIEADPWGRTSMPNIFAGGDIATGAGTVAHAIGSGRRAARAIEDYLLGHTAEQSSEERVVSADEMNLDYCDPIPRLVPPRIPVDRAVSGLWEIYQSANKDECLRETGRCLHCGAAPEFHQEDCRGCSNCSSRCPSAAISLKELDEPYRVGVTIEGSIMEQVRDICVRAKMHPESIVCFCTSTRAMEIAAAILKGAKGPEDISKMTGARTGCGVLCIEPIFRLMLAAGRELGTSPQSHVWYPTVPTLWEIPNHVVEKYEGRGFRFEEDKAYYQELISDERVCRWGKKSA